MFKSFLLRRFCQSSFVNVIYDDLWHRMMVAHAHAHRTLFFGIHLLAYYYAHCTVLGLSVELTPLSCSYNYRSTDEISNCIIIIFRFGELIEDNLQWIEIWKLWGKQEQKANVWNIEREKETVNTKVFS